MTELISQHIEVKPWPLSKVGDEKFFGYVVAMGVFPREWGQAGGLMPYVDFAYNEGYERYHLPNDDDLMEQLHDMLRDNIHGAGRDDGDGIYGKVWIFLTPKGYLVELP